MKRSATQDKMDEMCEVMQVSWPMRKSKAGQRFKPDIWAFVQGYKGMVDRGTSIGVSMSTLLRMPKNQIISTV
jgi:hypothetical protein